MTLKLRNRQSLEITSKIEEGKWIPVAERSNSSDQSGEEDAPSLRQGDAFIFFSLNQIDCDIRMI